MKFYRKFIQLTVFAGVAMLAFFLAPSNISAQASEKGVYEIKLTNSVHVINQNYTGYAFSWTEDGSFEYSWDGVNYQLPLELHEEDIGISDTVDSGKHFTDLMFDNPNAKIIYIRNKSASVVNLILIDPYKDPSAANIQVANTQNPGYINVNSGASYTELDIINRSEWGADEGVTDLYPEYRKIDKIIVHHTAGTNGPQDYAATVRSIHLFHTLSHGWHDIGYNYLIDPNGKIYEGRRGGEGVIGAHTYLYNSKSIGISFLGTYTSYGPTTAALKAFQDLVVERALVHGLTLNYSGPNKNVFGHRDFSSTSCPGNALFAMLATEVANAENKRQERVATSIIEQKRQETTTFFTNYDDLRLEVVFNETGLSQSEINQRIPNYSGIRAITNYTSNSAVIEVESYAYYQGVMYDDSEDRIKFLYLTFALNPYISEIRKLETPILFDHSPIGDNAGEGNKLRMKFSEHVNRGTGSITIRRASDDSVFETINVATAPMTNISSREIEFTMQNTLQEGVTYYVNVCNTCFVDDESNYFAGISDKTTWRFLSVLQWSDWVNANGKASAPVAMKEYHGRLFQVVRGQDEPYKLWVRSSDDLNFNGEAGETWSDVIQGKSSAQASLEVFNDRLYLAVRGNSGGIFTKYMASSGEWQTTWNEFGGKTGTAVAMTVFNNRLYQAIRGYSTNSIYVRSTSDGDFDGLLNGNDLDVDTKETWTKLTIGTTQNAVALEVFDSKLVMSVKGNSGEIWNVVSADGVFDTEQFVQNGGKTGVSPTLESFNGKLYQAVKGNSTNNIYTRITTDANTWNGWAQEEGSTTMRIEMAYSPAQGRLVQAIVDGNGNILTRYSL